MILWAARALDVVEGGKAVPAGLLQEGSSRGSGKGLLEGKGCFQQEWKGEIKQCREVGAVAE